MTSQTKHAYFHQLIEALKANPKLENDIVIIDYFNRLYNSVDKTKIDQDKFEKLVYLSQIVVDDEMAEVEEVFTTIYQIMEFLRPYKTPAVNRIKATPILDVLITSEREEPSLAFKRDVTTSQTTVHSVIQLKSETNLSRRHVDVLRLSSDEYSEAQQSVTESSDSNDSNDVDEEEDEKDDEAEDLLNDSLTPEEQTALKRIQYLDEECERLHRKIQRIEREEISLEEMELENTAFTREEDLKKKFQQNLRQMKDLMKKYPRVVDLDTGNQSISSNQPEEEDIVFTKKIKLEATSNPTIDKKIELKVNSKKKMPDYQTLIDWIKEENEISKLGISPETIQSYATTILTKLVGLAKLIREKDLVEALSVQVESIQPDKGQCRPFDRVDPAVNNPEIEQILVENKRIADEKINILFEKFVTMEKETKTEEAEGDDLDAEHHDNDFEEPIETALEDLKEVVDTMDVRSSPVNFLKRRSSSITLSSYPDTQETKINENKKLKIEPTIPIVTYNNDDTDDNDDVIILD